MKLMLGAIVRNKSDKNCLHFGIISYGNAVEIAECKHNNKRKTAIAAAVTHNVTIYGCKRVNRFKWVNTHKVDEFV